MIDILSALDKKTTTFKISFKGEICRIRFIDGVHLNVDSSRFGMRYVGKIESMAIKSSPCVSWRRSRGQKP